MGTVKALADVLGVSARTIRNHKKDGYVLVELESGDIDVAKSVHAFVKYQSETLRQIKAQKGRDSLGTSGNSDEPKSADDWKTEKEKQGAIKIRNANMKEMGESVPVEAMMELYNKPLSMVKNKLSDLSNQISKRFPLDPSEIKIIDDLVREALENLNEKGMDDLQTIITPIIERYSKYYSAADEDGTDTLGGAE